MNTILRDAEGSLGFWLACRDILGDDSANVVVNVSAQDAEEAYRFAANGLDRAARQASRERIVRVKLAELARARRFCEYYRGR